MLNFFRAVNVFYFTEIFVNFKIIYTTDFIIIFSDLGFFFFRIRNICFFTGKTGFYIVFYNYTQFCNFGKMLCYSVLNCCLGCFSFFMLSGIGFRVLVEDFNVFLRLGYSNLIKLVIPSGIFFLFIDKLQFCLYSINFNLLMRFCYYLRALKYNNVYKQRGLYFKDEIIDLKILRNKKIFF